MIDLRKTLLSASQALRNSGITHALIGGFAMAADGNQKEAIKSALLKTGFDLAVRKYADLFSEGEAIEKVLGVAQ